MTVVFVSVFLLENLEMSKFMSRCVVYGLKWYSSGWKCTILLL